MLDTIMKYSFALLILCAGISQYEAATCSKSPNSSEIYSLHIDSYIRYRYATTTVVSKVVNPKNNSQEVFFHMNLPETAFITSFVIEINEKEYEAYLKEKQEAKEIYDRAVASGQSAGHVATRDSNHFKISVNVEALGKIKFTLKYEELLQRTLGVYKQVINLNPGQTVRDLKVNVYITESSDIKGLFVPEIKVTNEIVTDEKENKIVNITRPSGNKAIVHYAPNVNDQEKVGGSCFEGQFIVQYDVDRIHPCGQVLIDEDYFVHFYAPEGLNPLRKLVVFVLDLSGSMFGRKLTQLKQAMTTILDELKEGDYFSLVDFSYSVTVHNLDSPTGSTVISPDSGSHEDKMKLPSSLEVQKAYAATKDYVNKAKQIISKMTAGGGTNIYDALKTAIKVSQKAYEKIRNDLKDENEKALEPMIMFLTDGEPTVGITNLGSILSMVRTLNIPRTPIYSLGFGYGADMNFLKKLSLENGAFGKKIYEASDAALQLRNFYKLISSPLLSNVTFTYIPSQVDNNSLTKKDFRSLFHGSELIVAGRLLHLLQDEVQIDVNSIASNGTASCTVQGSKIPVDKTEDSAVIVPEEDKKTYGSLERLWAYLTVKQLLDKQKSLDEGTNLDESSKLKETVLNLALKYKFVTPLTSLIVVKPNETDAMTELEDSSRNDGSLAPSFHSRPSGVNHLMAPGSVAYAFPGSYTRSASVLYSGMLSGLYAGAPMYHRSGNIFSSMPSFRRDFARPNAFTQSALLTTSLSANAHPTESQNNIVKAEDDPENVSTTQNTPYQENLTLSDLDWLDQILKNNYTMEVSIPVGNSTQTYTILDNPVISAYQNCTDLPGKCTHLVNCILPDFTTSLQEFLKYFCPITGNFVGVCCPFS